MLLLRKLASPAVLAHPVQATVIYRVTYYHTPDASAITIIPRISVIRGSVYCDILALFSLILVLIPDPFQFSAAVDDPEYIDHKHDPEECAEEYACSS